MEMKIHKKREFESISQAVSCNGTVRRILSLVLALAMLLPWTMTARALETDGTQPAPKTNEAVEETVPETTAAATVPETTEATVPETTAEATVPEETASPVQKVQERINALPEHVTEDNREAVAAQLQEILPLYAALTEAEQEQVDITLCVLLQQELDEAYVPQTLADTGAFTVEGGTLGTDYTYADGVLTIKTAAALTISTPNNTAGTPTTTDCIVVGKDVSANITLSGVNIDVSSTSNRAAFRTDTNNSTANVTITLADGTTNTLKSGNYCAGLQMTSATGTLTINGPGSLTAAGGKNGAGIGSADFGGDRATVIINGGTITATGGQSGAGIGGGYGGGTVTINGGTIIAKGGPSGAGIGGGSNSVKGWSGKVTIYGGTVKAMGGQYSAGIGGGSFSSGSQGGSGAVTIYGGAVTATGGYYGAGIGGGSSGGGTVTIEGGTVTATGGFHSAGIGGGNSGGSGNVTISGGTVTATGGAYGAGIGGGSNGSGTAAISGGTVTATGGSSGGAGIGNGSGGSGGTFSTGDNGSAWIIASSISDTSKQGEWSGIIFQNSAGQVYGNIYTLTANAEIPSGAALTIPDGVCLLIDEGKTLINNGAIIINNTEELSYGSLMVRGTLTVNGTLTNNGSLSIEKPGTLNGTDDSLSGDGKFQTKKVTDEMLSVPANLVYDGTDQSEKIREQTKILILNHEFTPPNPIEVEKAADSPLTYTVKINLGLETFTTTVTVGQSGTNLTARADSEQYTYGDDITVTATVDPTGTAPAAMAAAGRLRGAPTAGQMALYYGGKQVSDAVNMGNGLQYKMTVSVKDLVAAGAPYDQEITLTAKFVGNDSMADTEQTVTVTLFKRSLRVRSNHIVLESKEYDGTTAGAVESVEFLLIAPGETLELGRDYDATVEYDSPDAGTMRTARVTITLKNNNYVFIGSVTTTEIELRNQTIQPKAISPTITLPQDSYVWEGVAIEPGVKVRDEANELVAGEDYVVAYSDNRGPGTAEVRVTGIGNYSFTATVNFFITCPHPTMGTDGTCTVCHETIAATVEVGGVTTYYTGIVSAWNFAQGKTATVTMLIDQTISSPLVGSTVNTDLTLKMVEGVTLRGNNTLIELLGRCVLTLEQCNLDATGDYCLDLQGDTTVNVRNCVLTSTGRYAINVNFGALNVYSGSINGVYSHDPMCLFGGTFTAGTAGWAINSMAGSLGQHLADGYAYQRADGSWLQGDDLDAFSIRGTVTVRPIPVEITAGKGAAIEYGDPCTISVTAEAADSAVDQTITYQWLDGNGNEIVGANESTYNPGKLDVGSYTYSCNVTCDGYTLNSGTIQVNVGQKTLTPVISGNLEKPYDGTNTAPDGCKIELQGVAPDEDVSATGYTVTYGGVDAGPQTLTATGITLTGADIDNYALPSDTVTGEGTITQVMPEFEFEDQNITYGGTPTDAEVNSGGAITYSYVNQADATDTGEGWPVNAGTYTVTAAAAETDNYISGSASITLTVNRKPIQVPEAVTGLIYNGQTQTGVEAGTGYTLTGSTAKDAGAYNATAKVDGNHIWQLAGGLSESDQAITWNIKQKDITVVITANGGTYNGQPFPVEAELKGLVAGDDVPVTLTYTDGEGYNSTTAPADAGKYTVTASILDANYKLTGDVAKGFTIEQADPGLQAVTPVEKTYGDADFNLNVSRTGGGALTYTSGNPDVVTVDENGNVHILKAGSAEITAAYAETKNYTDGSITVTVKVAKAAATLTVEDIPEKTYGDEAFNIKYLRNGESGVRFTSNDPSVATVDESGKVTIVGAGSTVIKLTTKESENYLAASAEVNVVVKPKPIKITITAGGGVYGQTITGAKAEVEDLADGEDVEVTLTYTKEGEATGTTTVPKDVGVYTVTASIEDPNYILSGTVAVQFIVRQPITVTVNNGSKTYGEQDPGLGYEITDGAIIEGKPLNIQLRRTAGEDVGSYAITDPGAIANNPCYEITMIEGSLTIEARDIRDAKVVLGPALTANGKEQTQTVASITVVNSQGKTMVVTYTVAGNTVLKAGEYTMTITGTGNFTGTKEQTFTVNAQPTDPQPTDPQPTDPKPTESKPTEPKPTEKPDSPATGDNSRIGLWGMLLILSATGLAVLLKRKEMV